jgi:hypothetical protein
MVDSTRSPDSHIKTSTKAPIIREDRPPGPVPQRHRMCLGEGDGMSNPFGSGEVSTKSTIANAPKNY